MNENDPNMKVYREWQLVKKMLFPTIHVNLSCCLQTISPQRMLDSWLKMMCCAAVVQAPEWGKWKATQFSFYNTTTSVSCELKHQVLLYHPLPVLITTDRQMQSDFTKRWWYSADGLLSPLNFGEKDIIWHYLCVQGDQKYLLPYQKPAFQEETTMLDELCCNWVLIKVARRGYLMSDLLAVAGSLCCRQLVSLCFRGFGYLLCMED